MIPSSLVLSLALVSVEPEARGLQGAAADVSLERHEFERVLMGTLARVVVYAPDGGRASTAAREALERVVEIERALSDWDEASELSRLSARAGTGPVPVGADLLEVLWRARELAERTDGTFDPTVGPLTALFREARRAGRLPDEARLAAARARTGWRHLAVDPEAGTVALGLPGMRLDLGGIAKGWAAAEALAVLHGHGLERALVDLGGDLALGGPPPGSDGWRVSLGVGEGAAVRTLSNTCVATSGDTERHLEVGGVRYSHLFDPRSGRPLVGAPVASLVAPDGATADALASAVSVLGAQAGRRLVAAFPGAALRTQEAGFRELFDGKSLAGWTETGGRYDGDADWTVEDGCLVGRVGAGGKGGLLYTEELFTSYELELEVKMDYPFDSGVFLRMWPEGKGAQVTLDHRPDGEIAGIYSDGWLAHDPDGASLYRNGEWNHVRVRCTGFDMRIEAWVNGQPAIDYSLPAGSPGYAPTGRIGVQVHGDRDDPPTNAVRFRDVRVRELGLFGEEVFAPGARDGLVALTDAARAQGWRPLLDGESLAGWETPGDAGGYRVVDGVLEVSGGEGHLRTADDFTDFRLRLDFQPQHMTNSGLFLRAARDGSNPAFSGCEIQILDDFDWEEVTQTTLKPWQFTGSLYGAVPAGDHGVLRPMGEWNTYEVLYRGTRIAVALNGRTLYDVDTHALEADPPFAERAPTGFLGLQRHAGEEGDVLIRFRNAFVQPLD